MKLGGLSYIFNFQNDAQGGLRSNFPGRKDFLLREYWKCDLKSPIMCDIWAACLTLYILVTGRHPYPFTDLVTPLNNDAFFKTLPDMTMLSPELRDLLTWCFNSPTYTPPTIQMILVRN